MGPDVHVFKDQEFDSKWDSVQFDEEMNYVGLPGKDKLGILFEVKAYDPKLSRQKEVQSVGWAYLPLFVTVENENKSYSIFTNQSLVQVSFPSNNLIFNLFPLLFSFPFSEDRLRRAF